ncbi:MAG: LytTR family DNA-binding domain-containing protein [Bacteroidia bacterium]|nr:LytTR family DNA-binding domain-containing protein [Bacteroidia bacterium]
MKLRTLIIDDEPLAHDIILKYMEDVPFLELAGQFHLATDALSFLHQNSVDLIFLDIQMPKLSGLDFLKTLREPPIIIISSAYAEYAVESFELDVCDYLLKPFRFDRFLKATNKALSLKRMQEQSQQSPEPKNISQKAEENHQIFIKADKRFIQLETSDIYYLESYGNYVKVWMKEKFHLTSRTLSSFEDQLNTRFFIRIHKSYLINRLWVDFLEGNRLMLKNGVELPIGKNHKQHFKRFMSRDI